MAAAPTSSFLTSMSPQPPRTVQALVNEEVRAPPPVRLYPSQHRVSMTRYATSTDPRGYIPVFEYPLNGQYIMIDCETGMVHFTGIWKALGHTKADVVKLVESDPTIAPYLRKVRGGYLKIQGTWLPFDTAKTLARRVAWQVRYDLVPLFGPDFPDTCLGPGEPGFGQLLLSAPKPRGRRGAKKTAAASSVAQERTASPQENRIESRPGTYAPQDSLGNRGSGRVEPTGNDYGSMMTQARYSPYTRAPVHRITQLEPLPNLIQPNQSCSHPTTGSMYSGPAHYHHQNTRAPMMSCHEAGSYTQQPPTGPTPSGIEMAGSLPPMRHYQSHPAENNFFETYRGPDSFEALSNKWLAPEVTNPANLNDTGLLNGEGSSLPPLQYSNDTRKQPSGSPVHPYSYASQVDSTHSSHHRDPNQSTQVHNHSAYPYDSQQGSNFPHEAPVEEPAPHPSSPSQQAASYTNYDKAYNSEPQTDSQTADVVAGCHVPSRSNSTGKPAGSPGSHSSLVLKSPTPSSASTSTHMQNSNNHNSNRSPSNTLTNMSNNGSFNAQGEESIQFSVLTSPAHLENSG